MSEMLEKIVKAIAENYDPDRSTFPETARAVLRAMREPTKDMLDALSVDDKGFSVHYDTAPDAWRAMIDAALK